MVVDNVLISHVDIVQRAVFALGQIPALANIAMDSLHGAVAEYKAGAPGFAAERIVTKADRDIQEAFFHAVSERFPNDGRDGEESDVPGARPSASGRFPRLVWVVDPIDGTGNYAKNIGVSDPASRNTDWGISIACMQENKNGTLEPLVSVVAYPMKGRVIYASKGNGAWEAPLITNEIGNHVLNSARVQPLRLSLPPLLQRRVQLGGCYMNRENSEGLPEQSIGGVTYSWRIENGLEAIQTLLNRNFTLVPNTSCFTASMLKFLDGKSDAYVHPSQTLHDVAAMAGIVSEAGGKVDIRRSESCTTKGVPCYRCFFTNTQSMQYSMRDRSLLPPNYHEGQQAIVVGNSRSR